MNGWKIVPNPPFADSLFSEQQTAAWETLKQQLALGTLLTGKIYIQAQFGVFYDAGLGFPVLINVPEFSKSEGGMVFPDDYPALGSVMSSYLIQFDDHNRQLRTVNRWPVLPPTISHTGLPTHPLISIDPEIRFGRPCIIGTRISVVDVLAWLGNGMSMAEIITDFPELNEEMIQACLRYGANR